MPADIQELIHQQRLYYEVSPYYVLDDERPLGQRSILARVQAGFDVDLYATGASQPLRLSAGDPQMQSTLNDLQEVAHQLLPQTPEGSDVAIIPLDDSVILDTRRNLQPEALVRIRITHWRGLSKPEGPAEERVLSQIRENLRKLGIPERGGR